MLLHWMLFMVIVDAEGRITSGARVYCVEAGTAATDLLFCQECKRGKCELLLSWRFLSRWLWNWSVIETLATDAQILLNI
ncbi:hypothetical protein DQK91_02390 [Oceanidesulfovibrio marinus]|uniref:Uncharacterized protein n=1 Tax=Oceanidesulfovibrio marinus TaxID=370038 RepID=A0A6P1ZQD5_9BACT|nr:hypothetical protein DQK91_02390 [Oceanidesulfovibrio marinus]